MPVNGDVKSHDIYLSISPELWKIFLLSYKIRWAQDIKKQEPQNLLDFINGTRRQVMRTYSRERFSSKSFPLSCNRG